MVQLDFEDEHGLLLLMAVVYKCVRIVAPHFAYVCYVGLLHEQEMCFAKLDEACISRVESG